VRINYQACKQTKGLEEDAFNAASIYGEYSLRCLSEFNSLVYTIVLLNLLFFGWFMFSSNFPMFSRH
jgi:hypothetical protein